jgi:DNA repair exonuclease SbcCD nuclease subunit
MFKFMHVSDTHLGSRQYMIEEREQDFYDAFREAMDIALRENVDFIVHTGDLFDTWSPSNRALTEFKDSILPIMERKIPFFLILGDHDRPKRKDYPAARIFDFAGINLIGVDRLEHHVIAIKGDQILIAGISNLKGMRKPELLEAYQQADKLALNYKNSILMSHQAIEGFLYDEACEARYEELPQHFSYLAFGHVHDWALRDSNYPVFSYAGSTEMKSTNEISGFLKNGKSVNIVTMDNGEVKVERRRLQSVRFQYRIDSDFSNYASDLDTMISKYSMDFGTKKPVVSVRITGEGSREAVKEKLATYDSIIFRNPEFHSIDRAVEIKPGMEKISDYINSYFSDDPETAKLAAEFYANMGGRDANNKEEGIKWLKRTLGVGDDVN